jgi:hypothetical protein
MKYTSIKVWALILSLVLTICVSSCMFVKSQVNQQKGAKTEVVRTSIFNASASPLAIKNVNVLSFDCTKTLDSMTVLLKDGRIVNVAKGLNITGEYKVIDGTGQYLIPGLIDTHTHLHRSKNDLLLFLANGVTHIANNNSEQDNILLQWRKEANEGSLSPKIYIAAGGMSTKKGFTQKVRTLFGDGPKYNTTQQARKAVRKFKNQGYDAIKIYNLDRDIYFAVTEEARNQNIPVIGHLPPSASLEDLYNSGQSQLAHVEEITKATMSAFNGLNYDNTEEYLVYLENCKNDIAIKLREKKIVVSSTLRIIESIPKQNFDLENYLKTIELEYQNPGQIEGSKLVKGWLPGNNGYENMDLKSDPELTKKSKIFWKTYVEAMHIMTKALVDNGVTITTGTDSNGTGIIAGFSLHDEFESLSNVGMSNTQVMYAATVAPSQWLQSNAGKIEPGFSADLVLLDKNPLEDIKNTRTINAVIANGKFFDRVMLDNILQAIKDANNRSRKKSIHEFIN